MTRIAQQPPKAWEDVDQTPGNSVTVNCYFPLVAVSSTQANLTVPLPFVAKNRNYSVSASVSQEGIGRINPSETVKTANCMRFTFSGTYTKGSTYGTFGDITITFA